ncbi:MAG: hypothetical protein JO199_08405 [Candidatus Eremiobacteraeota bacterium]|nr:hypothetical protein [Candidatus Eremiobacteraeota bacterium]
MSRTFVCSLLAFAVFSTACSGSVGIPSGTPPAERSNANARHGIAVRFAFKIPRRGSRAHFVSPATQSVSVQVDAGAPTIFAISSSASYCTTLGGALACTLVVPVSSSGVHTFTVYAYDRPNGTGNKLASAVQFPYTIPPSATSVTIPLTMDGIAAGLSIAPLSTPVWGNVASGFTIYGKQPVQFSVVATDADGNYIVGPGAPKISLLASAGAPVQIAQPSVQLAPNIFTITSTLVTSNPTVGGTFTLTAQAKPAGARPHDNDALSLSTAVTVYTPFIYVVSFSTNAVTAYDEQGNQQPLAAGTFSGLTHPSGIAYDSHNSELYVTNRMGHRAVSVFDPQGNAVIPPYPADYPNFYGAVYDPDSDVLYFTQPQNATVIALLPNMMPFNLPPGAFSMSNATGLAYSSFLQSMFVSGGNGISSIGGFSPLGTAFRTTGGFPGADGAQSMSFDDHNLVLYVANNTVGTVTAYDSFGNLLPYISFPGVSAPGAILYDPYDQLVYVGSTNAGVTTYDEFGGPIGSKLKRRATWNNASSIYAMAVVP